MANAEHVSLLKQGADVWNSQLGPLHSRNLDLRGAELIGVELVGVNLEGADLTGANLTRSNLSQARLSHVNFHRTDLTEANLTAANLENAQFVASNLTRAILTKAFIGFTVFRDTVIADADLNGCGGFSTCAHSGPSILDIRTLQRSPRLPPDFLQGCGLPEQLIKQLPSLLSIPPDCFISYSRANEDFANRLHADLQRQGIRCWYSPHDMTPGKKLYPEIDAAIRLFDRLLLIISNESMESEWVRTEISKARAKERATKRDVIFPISIVPYDRVQSWELFDSDSGEDLAKCVREYLVVDFSGWSRKDAYDTAFKKLLSGIRSTAVGSDANPSYGSSRIFPVTK